MKASSLALWACTHACNTMEAQSTSYQHVLTVFTKRQPCRLSNHDSLRLQSKSHRKTTMQLLPHRDGCVPMQGSEIIMMLAQQISEIACNFDVHTVTPLLRSGLSMSHSSGPHVGIRTPTWSKAELVITRNGMLTSKQ